MELIIVMHKINNNNKINVSYIFINFGEIEKYNKKVLSLACKE